jgi:hypothetical protein
LRNIGSSIKLSIRSQSLWASLWTFGQIERHDVENNVAGDILKQEDLLLDHESFILVELREGWNSTKGGFESQFGYIKAAD